MPPKPGIHTRKDAFIHAMPAYCINLGLALDDMATAILIYWKARGKGIGTQLYL